LIAAAADQNGGAAMAWSNITNVAVGASAQGTAIGTGRANTTAIINQVGHTASAAKVCADYTVTVNSVTYDDWYLPSKDELNKLYINRVAIVGFASVYYWSSSEISATNAWSQSFATGIPDGGAKKGYSGRVRAVRAF
jgi:hypothetical protein